MDCSIVPSKHNGLFIISTTDYFYPSVDDPYVQGKIGACNVLSDMYACGVVDIHNVLMILASSTEMDLNSREIVTRRMIQGFSDACKEAGVEVTGGQTVMNPWPIIGGTAMSMCVEGEFLRPDNLVPGDVLVLTKPLGTQIAVNLNEWLQLADKTRWNKCQDVITEKEAMEAYYIAVESMTRLNRNAAKLMHKYQSHGATDVTGFGIMGHALNLARNQNSSITIEIHTLPIINNISLLSPIFPSFKLLQGFSAETSGGLLIALPEEKAEEFCREIEELDKKPAWIVGKVVPAKENAKNQAEIVPNFEIINVT